MKDSLHTSDDSKSLTLPERWLIVAICVLLIIPPVAASPVEQSDREIVEASQIPAETSAANDSTEVVDAQVAMRLAENDSIPPTEVTADDYPYGLDGKKIFNPSPARAVWLSALLPGLGEIYNRRYWKLPIVIGGFMGLGYATSWNNNQYTDYLQGYRDLMDDDPDTNSYMNFFPPNVSETDMDRTWLEQVFKARKDSYRRNRDLCIICLVALYLVCMVDSYVDASMAHFDISADLSLDVSPALWQPAGMARPSVGLNWAFTF